VYEEPVRHWEYGAVDALGFAHRVAEPHQGIVVLHVLVRMQGLLLPQIFQMLGWLCSASKANGLLLWPRK